MTTLERVWIAYLLTVLGVGLLTPGGGDAAHQPGLHAGVVLLLLGAQVTVAALAPRLAPVPARWLRSLVACASMPAAFSAMGLLLPAVHPEPYEWTWLAWDRAVFGADPTVLLQGIAAPAFVELLQWIYASFYLLPIGAGLLALRVRGGAVFDRCMVTLVFGFLASYLGYLLFPTLPPYRFLDHGGDLQGVWLAGELHAWIDRAEANRWDCFPSGHTMLSLVSAVLVWRHARAHLCWFLPLVLLLIASTLILRYHWTWDVFAGALLAWPTVKVADLLLQRDGSDALSEVRG